MSDFAPAPPPPRIGPRKPAERHPCDRGVDWMREHCETLCRTIAPDELEGRPLYIAFASEVDFMPGGKLGGVTGQDLDLTLRDWLGDRWQGRGWSMVLDDRQLREFDVASAMMRLACDCVHELGHCVTWGNDFPEHDDDNAKRLACTCRDSIASLSTGDMKNSGPGSPVPFEGHAWDWIRATLHLTRRAVRAGYPASPRFVADLRTYGLSSVFDYTETLNDDFAIGDRKPLAVHLSSSPPPVDFIYLWCADLNDWMKHAPEITEEHARILACLPTLPTPPTFTTAPKEVTP